jgi:multidrug resistance protein MdtO
MAAFVAPAPLTKRPVQQFFDFLKAEIAPQRNLYPVLVRLVVTVVLTFLIVATFQMPYAAISLYSVFTVDRSSRRAALMRTVESVVAITLGLAMGLLGVMLFAQLPLLTFAYYAFELFVVAYLIRVTQLPGPAMNMAMAIYSVHNVWERPYPAGSHVEQTLWVWLTLCLGFAVSVAVEFAFVRQEPYAQLRGQLTGRMRALAKFFTTLASQESVATKAAQGPVISYAYNGTAQVRQRIVALRTTNPEMRQQILALTTTTALIARLVDVAATIEPDVALAAEDCERLRRLAEELERVSAAIPVASAVAAKGFDPPLTFSAALPFLPELERAASRIPTAFSAALMGEGDPVAQLLDPPQEVKIFVPDAFSNDGYILFALKTMLASMLCYVIYSGLDWPGLSTSVVTCLVTALNTVGATNQKQLLRLAGATCGGLLALGSLIFLLPEIDSVTGVTLLVAAVSTFCAWFALTSQRLAYFGLQTALAFYLALIQDYSATTQLAPARDRALGVLLGVTMMWLVFNNLWPISAAEHMRTGVAENLRYLARLLTALDIPDRAEAIRVFRSMRDRIQEGLATVHSHADSVLFEFGSPQRRQHLALRDAILGLQAALRTLFVVEIAIFQYRIQVVPGTRPVEAREGLRMFDEAFSRDLKLLADAVDELRAPPSGEAMHEALSRFEAAVRPWTESLTDEWLKTRVAGIRSLARQSVELADSLRSHCWWC